MDIKSLPAGAKLFDVEGVPVAVSPGWVVHAWDSPAPRGFPLESLDRNGNEISAKDFAALMKRAAGRWTTQEPTPAPPPVRAGASMDRAWERWEELQPYAAAVLLATGAALPFLAKLFS